jgi:hypothetical protein
LHEASQKIVVRDSKQVTPATAVGTAKTVHSFAFCGDFAGNLAFLWFSSVFVEGF